VQTAPLPAPFAAFAADFSRRFGLILVALAALVARRLLRQPRLVSLIVPLWNRLNRAARRCERLMAQLAAGSPSRGRDGSAAAGRLPRPRRPGRGGPHPVGAALPGGRGWLVRALGPEAAAYAAQLESLLAEPAAAELLALAPSAGRILRPIAHMLGVGAVAPRRRATRALRAPPPVRPSLGEPASASPGMTGCKVPTPAAHLA
jgi:hypothetical protein